MSALDLLDDFGFEAAAIVLGPEGERARRGDVGRERRWRSVSKSVTGMACVLAAQEGLLSLDAPLEDHIEGVTLRHLLSHASGYRYGSKEIACAPEARRHYSNFAVDCAGEELARVAGCEFSQWVQERIAAPLQTSTLHWTEPPSVGAVGSLEDLARFAHELLAPTLLKPAWFSEMTSAQFPQLDGILPGLKMQRPNPFGLGVEIRGHKSPHWTGAHNDPATIGHYGMRGCVFWVDPAAQLALVVGTERDFGDAHRRVLPALSDAVLADYA